MTPIYRRTPRQPTGRASAEATQEMMEVFAYRQDAWLIRIVYAGAFGLTGGWALGWGPVTLWFSTYLVVQMLEFWLFKFAPALCIRASVPLLFSSSAVFGFLTLPTSDAMGAWGVGLATTLASGGLMNAAFSSRAVRAAFFASATPYLLYLLLLPLKAWSHGAPPGVVATMALTLPLFFLFGWLSWGKAAAASHALSEAREAADEARLAAEAADRAKSVFLATMSHEIRTPLNGVLGMAQVMSVDVLSTDQRNRLEVIRQSGQSLLVILNDVLDISKIESGKMELEEVDFDLSQVLTGASAAFQMLADDRGLAFVLDIAPDAEGLYRGDPGRIRQILYNLISNALKFTASGTVTVAAKPADKGLEISVSDTGIGMDEETCARIFQPFVQADKDTARRFGGTGLGLSICRRLVEMMEGAIALCSAPGEGSTFTATLPLPRLGAPEAEAAEAAPALAAKILSEQPLRVLVAEDNPINQIVLKTILEQLGLSPTVVANGRSAVDAWIEQHWDIVLMDIQMPTLDGPSATREIRKLERETLRSRTPILALTANVMAHQVSAYLAAGMDACVAKPIEIGVLVEAMEAALQPSASYAIDLPFDRVA